MKNRQSKIKPIKIRCENYMQTFGPEKVLSVVCRLNKSRFLKQKDSNNKK